MSAWAFVRPEPAAVWRLGVALLAGCAAAGSGIALLATSGWLISRAAQHPPVLALMVAIVGVRAFGLGRSVLRYVERLVGHDAAFRVLGRLRGLVYARLARLGPVGLARYRSGDLGARLVEDVDAVVDLLLRAVLPMLLSVLVAGGACVVVGALLPGAGLVLGVAVLLVLVFVPLLGAYRVRRAAGASAALRGGLATATTELLHGLPDLVAAGAASSALDRAAHADTRLRVADARSARSAGAGSAAVVVLCGLACCAALAVGIDAVSSGELAGVDLAVVALVPLALADVLGTVPDAVQHGLRARASLRRVGELLRLPDTVPDPENPAPLPAKPYALRLEGVRARWSEEAPDVLQSVDLALPPGRRIAVVGESGSGKSTLAAVLLRQLAPAGGRLLLAGTDVTALAAADVRRVVGLCAQQAYVFDSTVAENVRLARSGASDEEVLAALAAARLGDWVAGLPHGLATRVGEHGGRLSGGERQRLALARVLLADFPVVVLDEPAEHLDEPTAVALMADLLAATRDRAVLLLTHRTADLGGVGGGGGGGVDEVWRIDHGRLVPARA